ncbi:MAG: MFS transporter [Alphaproteobacteria bacterium]|nr:MFS transporter [Alphaproteobacteria bacterium]
MRVFYGWRIVAVCLVAAVVGNALGLFGASVYLHSIVETRGWPTGFVSVAATLFYLTSALLLFSVGSAIARFGPRPVVTLGALAMAGGVAVVGRIDEPWQVYIAFLVMGIGWACLSTTAVATTLAPWFEKYQGRAVSIASLGASVGGMMGAPALLFGIAQIGFAATTSVAALVALITLLPLAWLVLKRRPQDIGLLPDGAPASGGEKVAVAPKWTRAAAFRTTALRTVVVTFGLAMMVQVGFVTHQVTFLVPVLGTSATSFTVSATAAMALASRLALARFSDQIDQRKTTAMILVVAALAFTLMALLPSPSMLVVANIMFGLTVGNVTTLSPIIVRREFGARSFGAVFGAASVIIQFATALGPSFYGLLHDLSGGYRMPLLLAAALDIIACAVILTGSRPRRDTAT